MLEALNILFCILSTPTSVLKKGGDTTVYVSQATISKSPKKSIQGFQAVPPARIIPHQGCSPMETFRKANKLSPGRQTSKARLGQRYMAATGDIYTYSDNIKRISYFFLPGNPGQGLIIPGARAPALSLLTSDVLPYVSNVT